MIFKVSDSFTETIDAKWLLNNNILFVSRHTSLTTGSIARGELIQEDDCGHVSEDAGERRLEKNRQQEFISTVMAD